MGGCVASKLGGEEEVVAICRERKRQMKLAVERRYALSDAHCRYSHSLYAVSAAIKLFVARHSTPSSPFLVTFPPPNCQPSPSSSDQNNLITNPTCGGGGGSSDSTTTTTSSSSSSPSELQQQHHHQEEKAQENQEEEEEEEEGEEEASALAASAASASCGYLFMGGMMPPSPQRDQRDFGWDFFNPFYGVRPEVAEDDLRATREEEGIPELEEEEDEHVATNVLSAEEHLGAPDMGMAVIDTPARGRELLDALKDIEDHFIRAYDSAKHVSGMLEANKVHLISGLEEIKENSTKLIQAITWHRSNTARSSSCKSLVASSSKSSSSWTEYKHELFDGNAGMAAGSHSLTLGRLYAWEKKLYEEVKAGDNIRKLYEKKCSQLRSKNVTGDDTLSLDKSRAGAKELYSRILVAIRRAESISEKIQKLTSEELQPQIIELLHGLAQSWRMMLESHETQNMIIFEVKIYECPSYGKFSSDSHRLATLQLEAEIQNWKECFHDYIAAQKLYVEALHGWLSKFIVPEVEFCSRGRTSAPPLHTNGPPLYTLCHDWLSSMENLPDKRVSVAMRSFVKAVRALWVQQGEEQEQKRKVDKLANELDKKILSYQKAESRIHEPTKLLEYNMDPDVIVEKEDGLHHHHQVVNLMEKKETLESFRMRLDIEKERHNKCMQETQRMTLNGFQTGFSSIFESLVQFAKTSLKMYNSLVIESQSMGKDGNPSCLQGSHGKEENGG